MEDSRSKPPGKTAIFFQTLAGFVITVLVILGVSGSVYKMIAPDGWMAQAFGKGLAGGMAASFGLLSLALFAWVCREWLSARRRNRYSELFVYVFAGAGAVYTMLILAKEPFF
jgi:hypothetical protein